MNASMLKSYPISRRALAKLTLGGIAGSALLSHGGGGILASGSYQIKPEVISSETISRFTIPAAKIPDPAYDMAFLQIRFPESSSSSWLYEGKALHAWTVIEGEMQAVLSGPATLAHYGKPPIDLHAEESVTVSAGDTLIEHGWEGPVTYANTGRSAAHFLSVDVDAESGSSAEPVLQVGNLFTNPASASLRAEDWRSLDLVGSDAEIVLSRMRFQPGAELVLDDQLPRLRFVTKGVVDWTLFENGERQSRSISFYPQVTVPWYRISDPAKAIVLGNHSNHPAEYYELSIRPAS